MKLHVKKGDEVMVLTGKDRGRKGKILRVYAKKGTAIVENLNIAKRHQRQMQRAGQRAATGGIIDKPMPLELSNLAVVDKSTGKATRVGRRRVEGKWMRFGRKSGELIDSK
jgi:large subunit ribosomal protein L24